MARGLAVGSGSHWQLALLPGRATGVGRGGYLKGDQGEKGFMGLEPGFTAEGRGPGEGRAGGSQVGRGS